ncbi:sugar ABC transporter permease [Streptomyces sp. 891-h]|uniref:carbohydrate ABC transporter permease n=1 Tax=Streptomyces sp. 891-h TaxID=2720714 RepID=UPI001FAAC7F8|nr:sugar ABC transporter permease [Streptomyces sp. 891-h]
MARMAPRRAAGPTVPQPGHRKPVNRRRSVKPWNQRVAPYLFVLPNMLIFGLFVIYPAINNFNISMYDSGNGRDFTYVGGGNYQGMLSEAEFWSAARHTVIFAVFFVTLTTVVSIGLALLLNQKIKGRAFFRTVFFLPVVISPVVVGLIWGWIFERKNGLLNSLLGAAGLGEPGWLVNSTLAMAVVIFVGLWLHVGFYVLIVLAGLQGIDSTYYEAARMDGASGWQQLRLITLPLLRPTTMVVVILSLINGFQAFDYIWTLTGGGPVGGTTLMVQYIYEHAFQSPVQYGSAAAAAVVLFCAVFALTVLNYLYNQRKESA